MKKFLLLALLACSSSALAAADYPDAGRFIYYNIPSAPAFIIKDTKTGCEYITRSAYSSFTLVEGSCTVQK